MSNKQHENHEEDAEDETNNVNFPNNSSSTAAATLPDQLETDQYLSEPICDVGSGTRDQECPNVLHSFTSAHSEVDEISRDVVRTVAEVTFHNEFDQLTNHSSNTLGMRVKDSLIMKDQQTHRKQTTLFHALRTSLVRRVLVDDDQDRSLSRLESPAPSSDGENLSTKWKKSVTMDEDVTVFDGEENVHAEDEANVANDAYEYEIPAGSEETMYDFGAQKSFTSVMENENHPSQAISIARTRDSDAVFLMQDSENRLEIDKLGDGRMLKDSHVIKSLNNVISNSGCRNSEEEASKLKVDAEEVSIISENLESKNISLFQESGAEEARQAKEIISEVPKTTVESNEECSTDAEDRVKQEDKFNSSSFSRLLNDVQQKILPWNEKAEIVTVSGSEKLLQGLESLEAETNQKSRDKDSSNTSLNIDLSYSKKERRRFEEDEREKEPGSRSISSASRIILDKYTTLEDRAGHVLASRNDSWITKCVKSNGDVEVKLGEEQSGPINKQSSHEGVSEKRITVNDLALVEMMRQKTSRKSTGSERESNGILSDIEIANGSGELSRLNCQHEELEVNDEKTSPELASNSKASSRTNDLSPRKSSSKVFRRTSELSKKSSRMGIEGEKEHSDNDVPLAKSCTKVSGTTSKSLRISSTTNIRDVMIPRSSNLDETLLLLPRDVNEPKEFETSHVTYLEESVNDFESIEKSKAEEEVSGNDLNEVEPEESFLPFADNAENITPRMFDDKKSLPDIRTRDSRTSKRSKESSANIKEEENTTSKNQGQDLLAVSSKTSHPKESMLKVVAETSSRGGNIGRDDRVESTGNERMESSLNLISLQLDVDTKSKDKIASKQWNELHDLQRSVEIKKRNRFMEALRRGLQSKENRSRRSSAGSNEETLKVNEESRRNDDHGYSVESATELENSNEKALKESVLDLKSHRLSAMKNGQEEDGEDSVLGFEVRPKKRSQSFKRFFQRSGRKRGKTEQVVTKQLSVAEEPKSIAQQLYSSAADTDVKTNDSSLRNNANTSSRFHLNQDVDDEDRHATHDSHSQSVPNPLEDIQKYSEKLELENVVALRDDEESFVSKLDQRISPQNPDELKREKFLENDQDFTEFEEADDVSKGGCQSSWRRKRGSNGSIRKRRSSEEDEVTVKENFAANSEPFTLEGNSEIYPKNVTSEPTPRNSYLVFVKNSRSMITVYLAKPSVEGQLNGQVVVENEEQADSVKINDTTSGKRSHDLMTDSKEDHTSFQNVESIFKSIDKSPSKKCSSEDAEDVESLTESRKLVRSSGIEMSTIQSTRSLQDTRKRSKSKRTSGHKLFDGENIPFVVQNGHAKTVTIENGSTSRPSKDYAFYRDVNKSGESIMGTRVGFLTMDHHGVERYLRTGSGSVECEVEDAATKKSMKSLFRSSGISIPEDVLVGVEQDSNWMNGYDFRNISVKQDIKPSKSSLKRTRRAEETEFEAGISEEPKSKVSVQSNARNEKVEAKHSISNKSESSRTYRRVDENCESEEGKLANTDDRKRNRKKKMQAQESAKKLANSLARIFSNASRKTFLATMDSQTKPDDQFEITKIPLSSSNDCSTNPEENREEFVAIESLDSTHDDIYTDRKESIMKRSSKHSNKLPTEQFLDSRQSGLVLSVVTIQRSEASTKNQAFRNRDDDATTKSSIDDRETRKLQEKVYAAKSTVVSYAPMVESAKYIGNDPDDGCFSQDEETENRRDKLSVKSFAKIRKLFSRASVKHRLQDHVGNENDPLRQLDDRGHQETVNSEKNIKVKHRIGTDPSVARLDDDLIREVVVSSVKRDQNFDEDERTRKSHREVKDEQSKSEAKENCHSELLLLNDLTIRKNGAADNQTLKNHFNRVDVISRVETFRQVDDVAESSGCVEISRMGKESVKLDAEEDDCEDLERDSKMTLSLEDSKATSKDRYVTETQSVFSRGMKRLFGKRRSVRESTDDHSHAPEIQSPSDVSENDDAEVFHVAIRTPEQKKIRINENGGANESSKTYCPASNSEDEYVQIRLAQFEKTQSNCKSSVAAVSKNVKKMKNNKRDDNVESSEHSFSSAQTAHNHPARHNPNGTAHRIHEADEYASTDPRPSFASRRSVVVMMATPDPPRIQTHDPSGKHTENEEAGSSSNSSDASSSSPTFFYYLLGPTLDEALIDMRVVVQKLIDKMTGRRK